MPTEDGWEPSPRIDPNDPLLVWRTVPGSDVTLQVRNDDAGIAMLAYAADYHAYVEPLVDRMTACYTPTNSVSTSNHLNATAMDFDWEYYPWKQRGNLNGDKLARLRDLLAYWRGIMFWAGDWSDAYVDEMHHQMDYGSYDLERNGQLRQWIKDHIRADGFSTYQRGDAPVQAPGLTAQTLSDAMGGAVSLDRYTQLLPGFRAACVEAGLSGNLNRLAMFAAQLGEESGGLKWMEEIASGSEYEGRSDLGNTQPGDGVRFKGRGPIQITGRNNYSQLSQWAFGKGYVPSPTFFVDNPTQLSTDQYGFLGPVWYWTVARPQINSLCDAGDIVGVTKAINGGTNGLQDRTNRWNHCLAMGLAQLDVQGTTGPTPDTGDDDLSAEAERMIKELYDEYRKEKTGPSRSFMVPDGNPVDSPLGFLWNIDGNVENINITLGYLFGTTLAEEFVNTVASTGVAPASWAGNVNQAWLQQYGQQWCLGLIDFRAAIQTAFKAAGAAPVVQGVAVQSADPVLTEAFSTDVAAKTASAVGATVRAAVQQAAVPAVPAPVELASQPDDDAGKIADLYRSLKSMGLADALPIESRAPMAALLSILATKNGSQLGATS